jgi:hypothetical protein
MCCPDAGRKASLERGKEKVLMEASFPIAFLQVEEEREKGRAKVRARVQRAKARARGKVSTLVLGEQTQGSELRAVVTSLVTRRASRMMEVGLSGAPVTNRVRWTLILREPGTAQAKVGASGLSTMLRRKSKGPGMLGQVVPEQSLRSRRHPSQRRLPRLHLRLLKVRAEQSRGRRFELWPLGIMAEWMLTHTCP